MVKKITKKVIEKVIAPKFTGYKLNVKVNDIDFTTKGKTIKETLEKFVDSKEYPFGAKTPMIVTLKKGKKESLMRVLPNRSRRLLLTMRYKSTALEVFASTLERRFAE